MTYSLDTIDLQILTLLQPDARLSNAALSKELGMAPSAVLERVRKLESRGIIQSYHTQVNPAAVDQKLLAYISIKTSTPPGDMQPSTDLSKISEIQELHIIAGDDCLLAKVRVPDSLALITLMREKIAKVPGVQSTKTTIVLQTIKEQNHLPIPTSI
jgi:Lrp/AsnC family leucine-responsive transcriptional regulator